MTEEIDIEVDGEVVYIEVEELSDLEKLRWGSRAPSDLIGADGDDAPIDVGPEFVDFLVDLVEEQTVLTEELIEDVPQEELSRLFQGVVQASFEGETDLPPRLGGGTNDDDPIGNIFADDDDRPF